MRAISPPPFAADDDHPAGQAPKPFALPGPDGHAAVQALRTAVDAGRRVLSELATAAIERHQAGEPLHLTHDETDRLAAAFAASTAAADLLGRSRAVRLAERHRSAHFSATDDSTSVLADLPGEGLPVLEPRAALDYFLKLVPKLGIDPERWAGAIGRKAFTLAVATEKSLLERVQAGLAKIMAGQPIHDDQSRGASPLTGTEVVQQALDAAGVSSKNPQYADMCYRTNVLDSYSTAFDEELADPDLQDVFPAWVYRGIHDDRAGDDHRPKFDRYYPASATFADVRGERVWNCRCCREPITAAAWARLQAAGAKLEERW